MSEKENAAFKPYAAMQVDEEAVRKIGGKLREKYNEIASEPIPDRFTDLLNELSKTPASGGGESE